MTYSLAFSSFATSLTDGTAANSRPKASTMLTILLKYFELRYPPLFSAVVTLFSVYVAGYYLGRPIIYKFANSKWGKLCLLNQEKVEHSERYFDNHGKVATITGRLIPGIRHLISIPAGLAKMHYWNFLLYTTLGAGAWNCILAALGWYLHSIVPEDQLHDEILRYGEYIKWGIVALVLVAIAYFTIRHFLKKKK